MTYVNVLSKGFFNVTMDEITVGGKGSFCLNNCFAIIDTGVTLIAGPKKLVKQINEMLGAKTVGYGEYILNCNLVPSLPSIVIKFGDKAFPLSPERYILKQKDDKREGEFLCISGFMDLDIPGASSKSFSWVIGDIFLSRYYVEFDLERNVVGFATKRNPNDVNIWTPFEH